MTRRARLTVDLIACDGRGLCAELLPELITLDDWGYPLLSATARCRPRCAGRRRPPSSCAPGSPCGWNP